MKQTTAYNIGIVLLCLAVIVMIALVGRSAFIAGGRTACRNTNEDTILVEGFKCEERIRPKEFAPFLEMDINFENESI